MMARLGREGLPVLIKNVGYKDQAPRFGIMFALTRLATKADQNVIKALNDQIEIDKTKDNGSDVTVWFRCIPHPYWPSLVGTTLFVTVTNAPRADRLGATAPSFFALTSSDPTAAVQTPLNQYRSAGVGAASVTRLGLGQYAVRIPSAAYPKGTGIAVATVLSVSPAFDPAYTRYCNPQNWGPSGTDMVVNVYCYMGAGILADAPFSLRLTARTHAGGCFVIHSSLAASST